MSNCNCKPPCKNCKCNVEKDLTSKSLPKTLETSNKARNYRLLQVYKLAYEAHTGQTRKDGTTPFIVHPVRVARLVMLYGGTESDIIAALWHDVIEDCGCQWEEKMWKCLINIDYPAYSSHRIIYVVKALTKNDSLKNRAEKGKMALNHCLQAGSEFIKLCDRLDNIRDSKILPQAFLFQYIEETIQLLDTFEITGKSVLYSDDIYNQLRNEVFELQRTRFGKGPR